METRVGCYHYPYLMSSRTLRDCHDHHLVFMMQDFPQSLNCEKIFARCVTWLRAHQSLCLTVGWPWSGGKRCFTGNLFCSLRNWISSEALGTVMLPELHGTLVTCLICCICSALLSLEAGCVSLHLRPIWCASWHRMHLRYAPKIHF